MAGEGYEMVRYADDFVILCKTLEEARAALEAGINRPSLPLYREVFDIGATISGSGRAQDGVGSGTVRDVIRRIWRILAAMSLLLCLGVVGVWVRSYWVADEFRLGSYSSLNAEGGDREFGLALWHGRVVLKRDICDPIYGVGRPFFSWESTPAEFGGYGSFEWAGGKTYLGFGAASQRFRNPGTGGDETPNLEASIVFPMWFTALVLAIAPALGLRTVRRRWREARWARRGFCTKCGYDLRASPERCPECGEAIVVGKAHGDGAGAEKGAAVVQSASMGSFYGAEMMPMVWAVLLLAGMGWGGYAWGRSVYEGQLDAWTRYDHIREATRQAWEAIGNLDEQGLKRLLGEGAHLDPVEAGNSLYEQITGYDQVAGSRRLEIARVLLDSGADVKINGSASLPDAIVAMSIDRGWFDVAKRLVEKGANVNAVSPIWHRTPLMECALRCGIPEDMELVRMLLERGADPNAKVIEGWTPLHCLCQSDSQREFVMALAALLIEKGADVNAKADGVTVLRWAQLNERKELVAFLISTGAKEE